MESTRQKKVARLVQKEMGSIFLKKGREFLPGKICSVTVVRMSPDLSLAKIYLSIMPSGHLKEDVAMLNNNKSAFRFELGNRIKNQLKGVPEIVFYPDDSLDYIENIERLLNQS